MSVPRSRWRPRRHRSTTRAAIVTAMVAMCAAPAVRGEGVQTLGVVEVVDQAGEEIGAVDTASQGTVQGPALRARPLQRPGEILEAVPGLVVTQHSGEGKANQYFLRGFNLDHGTDFATYVDGMPVNMRSHAHGQGYTDLSFLIPELVSRMEFKKGPYDAEEGDFSSAGVARLALLDRLASNTAALTVGSFGYRRGVIAGSPEDPAKKLVYALEYVMNDGPWTRPDELRKLNAALRYASGDSANGFSVTALAYQGRWNATDQIPRRAVDSGLIGRFDTLDPSDGGQAQRYSLSGQWRRTGASGITQGNAFVIASRLSLYSNFTYFLNDPVNGDQFHQSDRRTLGGFNVSHTMLSDWGGRSAENTFGLQTRADHVSVGLFNTQGRGYLSTVRDDRVRQQSVSPWFQNRLAWTSWLRTIAGVRADFMSGSVASDNPLNTGKAHDRLISPKLGVAFGPWAKTEYYANWGRGLHSNDLRGATITVDPVTGNPAERVPLLVRTTGSEVGVRSAIVPGLVTTLALFRLDLDSELVFVGDAGTTEAARGSRRQGVEWTAKYVMTPWLSGDVQFAHAHARFRGDDPSGAGDYIPGSVERVVSAGLLADNGRWAGALRVRYLGTRPLVEDNSVRGSASTLLSGVVGYRFNKQVRVQVEGFNLLNRKASQIEYFYESRLRGESAGVSDVHFHPAEPRSARASVVVSF